MVKSTNKIKLFGVYFLISLIFLVSITFGVTFEEVSDESSQQAVINFLNQNAQLIIFIIAGIVASILIILGFYYFFYKNIQLGITLIFIGVAVFTLIPFSFNLISFLGRLPALAFLIIVVSFILYFIALLIGRDTQQTNKAKILLNVSAGLIIFGILIIEIIIFSLYLNIKPVSNAESCANKSYTTILHPDFFACVFTGYRPVGTSIHDTIAFWIFIVILPAAIMFAITFGIFFSIGLDTIFGRYGKPVVSIIAFATALYGARQLIGVFLIELFAYGIWGIFGILIALILAFTVRMIGLKFLKDIEVAQQSIYGMFIASELALLTEIERLFQQVEQSLSSGVRDQNVLRQIGEAVFDKLTILEAKINQERDSRIKTKMEALREWGRRLLMQINNLIRQAQQGP